MNASHVSGFEAVTDVFTEPKVDPDTLANLGPLRPLAGRWQGRHGVDIHPSAAGSREEEYDEVFELEPIDGQTNGPQLFYGLRYHQHVFRPGRVGTFHDQVGYLLWEPATGTIHMTLAIPRGQVAMATGIVSDPDARAFTLRADAGDAHTGIVSNPFLDYSFATRSWEITFTIAHEDSWSYDQSTVLSVLGRDGDFDHRDRCTLHRVDGPSLNPRAQAQASASR